MDPRTRRARQLGRNGEALAELALQTRGFEIVGRNERLPSGEIDIVARDALGFVFVEVKTRRTARFGAPWRAVNWRKRACLEAAALEYLESRGLVDADYRFGIVSIVAGPTAGQRTLQWFDHA